MAKILITSKNSPNGIIQKPIGSNVYKNILSFDSPAIKIKFINRFYMNEGEDYIKLLEKKTDKPFIVINDISASLNIDVGEYPNETRMSMLNKDTAIVSEDGMTYFYALINPIMNSNNTITYDAELDVFLTYDIKSDILFQGQVEAVRIHTDRYDGVEYISKDNYFFEESLEFATPVQNTEKITLTMQGGKNNENITWAIAYVKTSEDEEGVIFNTTVSAAPNEPKQDYPENEYYDRFPYKIFLFPIMYFDKKYEFFVYHLANDTGKNEGEFNSIKGSSTYSYFMTHPNTLSIHYVNGFPISDVLADTKTREFNIHILNVIIGSNLENFNTGTETMGITWDTAQHCIELKDIGKSGGYKAHDLNVIKLNKPILTSFAQKRRIQNEVKLQYSQFKHYNIVNNESKSETLIRELFDGDYISLGYIFTFQAELMTDFIFLKNDLLNDNEYLKIGSFKIGNSELPTASVAYQDYLNTHRTTSKTGYLNVKAMAAGATAGAVAGGAGGPVGVATGAAIGGIMGGIMGGISHSRNMRDLKKTPDRPDALTDTYGLNLSQNKPAYLAIYSLPELHLRSCYDYLYKNGYFVRQLRTFKDIVNTRYYFNYIQTGDVYNNITSQQSASVKQLISSTLQDGLRVWHVRDVETFKGIENYKYENQEMSIINNEKSDK